MRSPASQRSKCCSRPCCRRREPQPLFIFVLYISLAGGTANTLSLYFPSGNHKHLSLQPTVLSPAGTQNTFLYSENQKHLSRCRKHPRPPETPFQPLKTPKREPQNLPSGNRKHRPTCGNQKNTSRKRSCTGTRNTFPGTGSPEPPLTHRFLVRLGPRCCAMHVPGRAQTADGEVPGGFQ